MAEAYWLEMHKAYYIQQALLLQEIVRELYNKIMDFMGTEVAIVTSHEGSSRHANHRTHLVSQSQCNHHILHPDIFGT